MRYLRQVFSLLFGPPLLVIGTLCAAAALGAQFGRISDRWDLLTHFAAAWGLVGLLAAGGGLVCIGWMRPALVAVGVVGTALAGSLMLPEYLRDTGPKAPADAPRQLKLIQFNILGGENQALEQTIAWIAAQRADVVTIQESSPRARNMMLARTGMHLACMNCEVMVFSRMRPVSVETPGRPDNASGAPVARASFRDARGEYTVLAVHQPWPTPGAGQQYEGRILAKVMQGFPNSSLILAGDFNSTSWSFSRRREDGLLGLTRRDRAVFSWPARLWPLSPAPAPFPLLPIDHVYAGDDWSTVKVERGPRLGSDHYPLIVTLARRARFSAGP